MSDAHMSMLDLQQALAAPESCRVVVARQATPRLIKLALILSIMDLERCKKVIATDPVMKGNSPEDMLKCVKLCEEAVTEELASRGVIAMQFGGFKYMG